MLTMLALAGALAASPRRRVACGFAITAIALLSGPYRLAAASRAAIRVGIRCRR